VDSLYPFGYNGLGYRGKLIRLGDVVFRKEQQMAGCFDELAASLLVRIFRMDLYLDVEYQTSGSMSNRGGL
jgi:hypothetical protein